jgi:2-hydroxy-3-keto-5-methylthiopentenyl-1-phosphate phosphatase
MLKTSVMESINCQLQKKKIDMLILSSGKRFYINKIINYLEKYFQYNIKKTYSDKNLNYRIIGSNKLAKKLINYKTLKTPVNACKEILENYL